LSMYKAIRAGPFGHLMQGHFIRGQGELSESADSQLVNLRKAVCEEYSGSPLELILTGAIDALHFIFKEVASLKGADGNPGYVWKWSYLISQRFLELLRGHDSAALAIFSYFAVLTKADNVAWFHEGWAERAVHACSCSIKPSWKNWIDWPAKQIEEGLKVTDPSNTSLATPSLSPVDTSIVTPVPTVGVFQSKVLKRIEAGF
jgi:hypothetical protein